MCGISGYISSQEPVNSSNILRMTQAIKHRGPDDEGYLCVTDSQFVSYSGKDSVVSIKQQFPALNPDVKSKIAVGFRRLSIMDLSDKGHQPMTDHDVCITFNGELYNYQAIKSQLIQFGYVFKGNSDTEVVLKSYLHWGIQMVDFFNGMFAIAIVDLRAQKTFLIRDRIGIKPLFYFKNATHISWCSEIKGILEAEWVRPEINLKGLAMNFQFKTTPPPLTCFQKIYSVPPACILAISHQDLSSSLYHYWNIPNGQKEKTNITYEDAINALEDKLNNILSLQLQCDVPLICMMSGGIDSSLLTALAHSQDPTLSCYTMGIDGSGKGLDELPQAKKMAKKLAIKQYIQQVQEADVMENALNYLSHFEEPYNDLDVFFTSSKFLRQQGFKVVISGNGADEIFGGYGYNLNLKKWQTIQRLRVFKPLLPSFGNKIKKLKYYSSLQTIGQYFQSTTGGFRDHEIDKLMPSIGLKEIQKWTSPFIAEKDFESAYEGLFYYDLKYSVGAHHVYHDDICAMRYGVEMRFPYLDHELIELVASFPLSYRYDGKTAKPLLRSLATPYIEPENLTMKKKGFVLPQDEIMNSNKDLKDFVAKQILFLKSTDIFNNDEINLILNKEKARKHYSQTWQLVSTAIWLQKYY